MGILYFIILVGVLIFVHEYGHYIVAKAFKVKVLSFSVGFGPKAMSFMRGETEWVIRWLPLGGYVQMLGHDPTDPVPDDERHRAFQFKPLWQRSLIILAGPVFNLLLPIPIFWTIMMFTKDAAPPAVVGGVLADEPSEGKLEAGDRIIAINGEEVVYWHDLVDHVTDASGEELAFTVERDGEEHTFTIIPAEKLDRDVLGLTTRNVGRIGVSLQQYAPVIGISDPSGPAARAGLQTFDKIMAVDGEPVDTYLALKEKLVGKSQAELLVLRAQPLNVDFGNIGVEEMHTIRLNLEGGKTGMESAEMYIARVDPGSPAEAAGLQVGDRLLGLEGKPYNHPGSLMKGLSNHYDEEQTLQIRRGTEKLDLPIQLEVVDIVGEFKEERPIVLSGYHHHFDYLDPPQVPMGIGARWSYAASKSISTTLQGCTVLARGIYLMATGEVSTKSIGGPIMIGAMASKAGKAGIEFFLQMMAFISINLGIINLLPIPMLDGGHLMIFGVEAIKRGPLSMRTRQIISFVGLAIIVFLMLLAFKNDIERYWSELVGVIL